MTNTLVKFGLVLCCFLFVGFAEDEERSVPAQVVALDECDPATFNAPTAAGPDFCKNVAVGASTTFFGTICESGGRHARPELGL